jgi:branched-chain amino acid transport system ATP-binding protein
MTLLRLTNVGKSYGGVSAVRNFSFDVEEGEVVGLMGANGAGKTTVFSLIAGTQPVTTGQIWFAGQRIDQKPAYLISRLGIARTFQIVRPFSGLTVLDNLIVAALHGHDRASSRSSADARSRAILQEVGLADQANRLAGSLTLAGRKRLEIARAIATGPRLLLLDEVLAGLTATEVVAALDMIRHLRQHYQLTLVVIEHVMRALMKLCSRIVVLHHGEMLAEGVPADIVVDQRVISAYFGKRAS